MKLCRSYVLLLSHPRESGDKLKQMKRQYRIDFRSRIYLFSHGIHYNPYGWIIRRSKEKKMKDVISKFFVSKPFRL